MHGLYIFSIKLQQFMKLQFEVNLVDIYKILCCVTILIKFYFYVYPHYSFYFLYEFDKRLPVR